MVSLSMGRLTAVKCLYCLNLMLLFYLWKQKLRSGGSCSSHCSPFYFLDIVRSVGTLASNYHASSYHMLSTIYLSTWQSLPPSLIVGNELKVHLIMCKLSKSWQSEITKCYEHSIGASKCSNLPPLTMSLFRLPHTTGRAGPSSLPALRNHALSQF